MPHTWSDEQARWIFRRAATLRARGAKPVSGIVLPTHEFYPDKLDASPKTVRRFFSRTLELAGLDFLDVKIEIVATEESDGGSCSTGGCSAPGLPAAPKFQRLTQEGDGAYVARLAKGELSHPTVLASAMVRTVAAIFLTELDALAVFSREERDGAVDLAATLLGFGPIVANGSAIEVRGCSGMKVHAATALGQGEAALALAISCALEEIEPASIAPHLGRVVLEAFADAVRFVGANRETVTRIDASPASIEDGIFKLKEAGGLFSRAFAKIVGKKADDFAAFERDVAALSSARSNKPRDPEREAKLLELRALVDETLSARDDQAHAFEGSDR